MHVLVMKCDAKPQSIFSNLQHFGGYTACIGVACPLPAFGGSIRPWLGDGSNYNCGKHIKIYNHQAGSNASHVKSNNAIIFFGGGERGRGGEGILILRLYL